MDATKTLPPAPGSTLKNGAIVITTVDTRGHRYVLGLDDPTGFVTWWIDDGGNCSWGHYFGSDDFFQAVVDLRLRAGIEFPRYGP